jgi:hypothetical protein
MTEHKDGEYDDESEVQTVSFFDIFPGGYRNWHNERYSTFTSEKPTAPLTPQDFETGNKRLTLAALTFRDMLAHDKVKREHITDPVQVELVYREVSQVVKDAMDRMRTFTPSAEHGAEIVREIERRNALATMANIANEEGLYD